MADINRYLKAIQEAVFGEEVRGSIHDAIEIINDVGEKVLSVGTAVTDATSSTVGFYKDSLYLNSDTSDLWRCLGSAWTKEGSLKGVKGDDGANGNRWYRGNEVTGKSKDETIFTVAGDIHVGDNYLNNDDTDTANVGNIYHCTRVLPDGTTAWVYDFTMVGGGGGGSVDIDNDTITENSKGEIQVAKKITDKLSALDNVADTYQEIKDATSSTDGVVTAMAVQKFANKYTERFTCTIPVGMNVKGIWQEGDPSTWVADEAHMVILPMFYEDSTEEIEATFLVSDFNGEYVPLLGYQHAPQTGIIKDGKPCGGLCIKIGDHEHDVKVAIDITRLRNEIIEDATT